MPQPVRPGDVLRGAGLWGRGRDRPPRRYPGAGGARQRALRGRLRLRRRAHHGIGQDSHVRHGARGTQPRSHLRGGLAESNGRRRLAAWRSPFKCASMISRKAADARRHCAEFPISSCHSAPVRSSAIEYADFNCHGSRVPAYFDVNWEKTGDGLDGVNVADRRDAWVFSDNENRRTVVQFDSSSCHSQGESLDVERRFRCAFYAIFSNQRAHRWAIIRVADDAGSTDITGVDLSGFASRRSAVISASVSPGKFNANHSSWRRLLPMPWQPRPSLITGPALTSAERA